MPSIMEKLLELKSRIKKPNTKLPAIAASKALDSTSGLAKSSMDKLKETQNKKKKMIEELNL